MREAQALPPQAKVVAVVAAGIWAFGDIIVDILSTPTMPAVPGGLGIPGYNPFTQTYTPPGSPPAKVNSTSTAQPADPKPNSREGKPFTPKEKEKVIEANKAKNNGATVCENCKTNTTKPDQSKKGVTPPTTDTQVDHVKPKSKGGSGTADNGQVLCRDCNGKKSDKVVVPEKKN